MGSTCGRWAGAECEHTCVPLPHACGTLPGRCTWAWWRRAAAARLTAAGSGSTRMDAPMGSPCYCCVATTNDLLCSNNERSPHLRQLCRQVHVGDEVAVALPCTRKVHAYASTLLKSHAYASTLLRRIPSICKHTAQARHMRKQTHCSGEVQQQQVQRHEPPAAVPCEAAAGSRQQLCIARQLAACSCTPRPSPGNDHSMQRKCSAYRSRKIAHLPAPA